LLNDGVGVGTVNQGGDMHITVTGLAPGSYKVYTYAVAPFGNTSYSPVYVPQAVNHQLQSVTGPMPGNSFEYLVTHSIHEVSITVEGQVDVIFDRAPFSSYIVVNGFQVVPVEAKYGPFEVLCNQCEVR
jgi:hypothetical protein